MAIGVQYPRDVAEAFLQREAYLRSIREAIRQKPEPVLGPTAMVLETLVETLLFASMEAEEGRIQPVGIVFADDPAAFRFSETQWDVMAIASPREFTVREVTKLASICEFQRSFLAVTPQSGELKILGVATPVRRRGIRGDDLVRVLAPRPGTVIVCRGFLQRVRYERGTISEPPPPYLGEDTYQEQLISIAQTVLSEKTASPEERIFDECHRVISEMSRLGHGGIIAILGPDEPGNSLLEGARSLKEWLPLGTAIREHQDLEDAFAPENSVFRTLGMEDDRIRAMKDENARMQIERAKNQLDRLRQQLVRLTTVDGAVLLSHSLDVLGFGVKLPNGNDSLLKVSSAIREKPDGWNPIEGRGTRHRAAAAFAKDHPKGLAFIVSQDGDAAVFQFHSGELRLVHWPWGIQVELST